MVSKVIDAMINNDAHKTLELTSITIAAAYDLIKTDYSKALNLLIKVQSVLPAPSLGIITSIGDILTRLINKKEPVVKVSFLLLGQEYIKYVRQYKYQEWSTFDIDFSIEDILAIVRVNNTMEKYYEQLNREVKNFDPSMLLNRDEIEELYNSMNTILNDE